MTSPSTNNTDIHGATSLKWNDEFFYTTTDHLPGTDLLGDLNDETNSNHEPLYLWNVMNEEDHSQYGYTTNINNIVYTSMRTFDSQWKVDGGSVLEILSFDSWIPEMKNVHLINFRMGVVCVDEKSVVTFDPEYRPKINVPEVVKEKKRALSFKLNHGNQGEFKNEYGRPLEKILVTFSKESSCRILSFTLRFGTVREPSSNHLDNVYRFLLGAPTKCCNNTWTE